MPAAPAADANEQFFAFAMAITGLVTVAVATATAAAATVVPLFWNRRLLVVSCVIHLVGGAGNVLGDGASKYLLLAKCIFGGDRLTPADDAYDCGDRGEIRPVCC